MSDPKVDEKPTYHRYAVEKDPLATPAQKRFFASDACAEARQALKSLAEDTGYNTSHSRPEECTAEFVDRHLLYLSKHPMVKLDGYLANLKLMTSVKRS